MSPLQLGESPTRSGQQRSYPDALGNHGKSRQISTNERELLCEGGGGVGGRGGEGFDQILLVVLGVGEGARSGT